MIYLVIVLRLIHIVSGVVWVGSGILNTFFLAPAVAATADAGQRFMGYLLTKAHLSMRITIAAILTVLSGSWLYWIDSQGLSSAWKTSGAGLGFGIGAIFGFIGLGFGLLVGKYSNNLAALATKTQGKPTPEDLKTIQGLQAQLSRASHISTGTLLVALSCMATARYWSF